MICIRSSKNRNKPSVRACVCVYVRVYVCVLCYVYVCVYVCMCTLLFLFFTLLYYFAYAKRNQLWPAIRNDGKTFGIRVVDVSRWSFHGPKWAFGASEFSSLSLYRFPFFFLFLSFASSYDVFESC